MNKQTKKTGRPRKPIPTGNEIPDVAMTHSAAEKLWNIPLPELARAKREGCAAFKGNRIYRDPLIQWLKVNPRPESADRPDSVDSLKNRKLKAAVELLEHKLQLERKEVVAKTSVQTEWQRLWAIIETEAKNLMDKSVFPIFIARIKAQIK